MCVPLCVFYFFKISKNCFSISFFLFLNADTLTTYTILQKERKFVCSTNAVYFSSLFQVIPKVVAHKRREKAIDHHSIQSQTESIHPIKVLIRFYVRWVRWIHAHTQRHIEARNREKGGKKRIGWYWKTTAKDKSINGV